MTASLPRDALWAEQDWVSPTDQRRGTATAFVLLGLALGGGGLYLAGIIWIRSGTGIFLFSSGLVLLLATGALTVVANPYRRTDADESSLRTIFHLSPALWEEGRIITLEVNRCRKKQFIAERWAGRRSRLVYFFPQRPTYKHARGQTLAGKRGAGRYLYEMEVTEPIARLYRRGSALATPSNVTVVILRRQEVAPHPRRRIRIRPRSRLDAPSVTANLSDPEVEA